MTGSRYGRGVSSSEMSPEAEPGSRASLAPRIVLVAAILVAVIVRVLYLDAKPFWRDEAWVAVLVDEPARAISGGRPVPFGFLWLTRLVRVIVPGPAEVSYRFVPLLAGIAIVPLLARMATTLGALRWVAVSAAWTAVGLLPLVYYSRELKPYGIDALLAILVPMLAIAGYEEADSRRAARIARTALLALLIAAPWVTYAGIFPIAALLSWGWLFRMRGFGSEERRDLVIGSAAFAASFVASYLLTTAPQATNPRLMIYWHSRMLGSGEAPLWSRIATGVHDYFYLSTTYFFGMGWKPIVLVAAIGAVTWPRTHRMLLVWMYFAAAAFCIAAALADRYLIAHGRHLLFALPPLLLWTAQGLWTITRPLGWRLRPAVTVAIPVVFALLLCHQSIGKRVGPYKTNSTEFFRFDTLQDMDEAIAGAEPLVEPGDAVIVSLRAGAPFQFYQRGRLPQATFCEIACPEWEDLAARWLAGAAGPAWLFMTDEEVKRAKEFLPGIGFSFDERVSVRGVRVWELRHAVR